MGEVEPYSLQAAQALVADGEKRAQQRHAIWRALELLYRRGEVREEIGAGDVPDILLEEMPGLTLDGINMVLPNAQIIIASAFAHDPAFIVEPYSGGEQAEEEAKFGEQLLKYFWRRLRGTDIHRSMSQDAVVLGNGFCKVGWAYAEKALEREDDELVEELVGLVEAEARAAELEEREPRTVAEISEALEIEELRPVQDEPFIEYVSPYDMLVPKRARRLEECRWIAQRMVLPVDEIKANELFDSEALDQLSPTHGSEDRPDERAGEDAAEGEAGESSMEDDPFAEATLYEFYDMRTRRMMVFQENADKPLLDMELPYGHRHAPYVHMRNMEDGGRRFWSFGDIENIASIQEEFNQYVYEQMASARRSGNKYAVDSAVWTEDVKKFLESEQSDVAVPLQLGQRNINDVIMAMQRQPVPAEVFQAKNDLLGAMHSVMGINDFQAGGSGPDRMSATAAAVVDGTATMRASDKKWQVENAAAETGLRILLLCQEFLEEDFALRVVGPRGDVEWLDVSKEDLTGEFGVSVTSGSTMAVNPATRMARALDVMTQIIPALEAGGYDSEPLWRQALRDYGMDPDRMLKRLPMPPPGTGQPQGQGQPSGPGSQPTVPQEGMGGPPVQAAVAGEPAL